jgi:hypothetical protein
MEFSGGVWVACQLAQPMRQISRIPVNPRFLNLHLGFYRVSSRSLSVVQDPGASRRRMIDFGLDSDVSSRCDCGLG